MIDIHCHFQVIEDSCYYWVFKLTRDGSGHLIWGRIYGLFLMSEVLDSFPNSFPFDGLRVRSPIMRDGYDRPYLEGDLA